MWLNVVVTGNFQDGTVIPDYGKTLFVSQYRFPGRPFLILYGNDQFAIPIADAAAAVAPHDRKAVIDRFNGFKLIRPFEP